MHFSRTLVQNATISNYAGRLKFLKSLDPQANATSFYQHLAKFDNRFLTHKMKQSTAKQVQLMYLYKSAIGLELGAQHG